MHFKHVKTTTSAHKGQSLPASLWSRVPSHGKRRADHASDTDVQVRLQLAFEDGRFSPHHKDSMTVSWRQYQYWVSTGTVPRLRGSPCWCSDCIIDDKWSNNCVLGRERQIQYDCWHTSVHHAACQMEEVD